MVCERRHALQADTKRTYGSLGLRDEGSLGVSKRFDVVIFRSVRRVALRFDPSFEAPSALAASDDHSNMLPTSGANEANLMDEAEADALAVMSFPKDHRPKTHSINSLERLSGEIKRCTDVVGIFPNESAVIRLDGALLLEQNDEWAVQLVAT
jgi:transposase-like protein